MDDTLGFFNKIGYTLYLSLLWFICCIPIFTIGASTTAYCYVLNKMIFGKEGYIARDFFKAFKDNFKSATKVWLIFMVAIAVVVMDYYIIVFLSGEYGGMYYALIPAYIMILCLLWAMLIYVFPYMAKFEDTTKNIIKNAFLMSTRHFGYTILLMVLDALIIFVGIYVFVIFLLLAPALIGFINMGVLGFVLGRYQYQDR